MKTAQEIILAPVITEKSMTGIADKKYVFKVAKDATKVDIAAAVIELFGLKTGDVKKVNTVNVRGQERRVGRYSGYTASWKKAVVTLKESARPIQFFEGLM